MVELFFVALIVFAVFAGIALVIGTVAGAILVANGKITLPNTNMRRIQTAKVTLEVERINLERERIAIAMDQELSARLALSAGEPKPTPDIEVLPWEGKNHDR